MWDLWSSSPTLHNPRWFGLFLLLRLLFDGLLQLGNSTNGFSDEADISISSGKVELGHDGHCMVDIWGRQEQVAYSKQVVLFLDVFLELFASPYICLDCSL